MTKRAHVKRAGFTLLEVLVALAVMATAMTVLVGTMANSNQQAVFANEVTTASMLAKSKMIDIEYQMLREGFTNTNRRLSGSFREEGYPNMRWEATIEPVEIPPEVRDDLLAKINAQLFGGVEGDGALQGNAAFSSMLPMLIGQLPEMINRIGQKVRRVELIVSFPYGTDRYPISVIQYIVDQDTAEFELFSPADAGVQ
ncbi:MAG: type II secretion system protein [Myxococcota bacterium]